MTNSLCQLAGDWNGSLPTEGMTIEPKIDGWRCLWFRGIDGKARLWSRNGRRLEGVAHLAYRCALMEIEAGEPLFLDAEIQIGNSLAETKAWLESGWKRGGERGRLYLFDGMPEGRWRAGGGDQPQHERKAFVKALADATSDPWDWRPGSNGSDDPTAVQVMPEEWAFDAEHVVAEVRRIWAGGGEGAMLKDPMAPYRLNRNSSWLKVKGENMHKWSRAIAA